MYEQQAPEEWEFILEDSGAVMVCVATQAVLDKALPLVGSATCPNLRQALCFDTPAGSSLSFAGAVSAGREDHHLPAINDLRPEELATLIYTSGTTGQPKGVMLSHRNICSNVKAMRQIAGHRLNPDTRSLSFLPWAHVYGQTVELHSLISAGASMGLAQAANTILEDIRVVRPTILVAVPTVYNKIYDAVKLKVSGCAWCVVVGRCAVLCLVHSGWIETAGLVECVVMHASNIVYLLCMHAHVSDMRARFRTLGDANRFCTVLPKLP